MKNTKPIILVPMAGNGSRFKQAGFNGIKPLIPIFNKPMIEHVVNSVGLEGDWIFIVQKSHRDNYDLDKILSALKPGCTIIDTGAGVTEGAACSVLLAEKLINNDRPLIIINSDNIIKWNSFSIFDHFVQSEEDGLILCFEADDPKWSYVKLSKGGFVTEVAEKKAISKWATAGLYIWKRGSDFVKAAHIMIDKNIRTNNEFYLCPVYNENIRLGQRITMTVVKEMDGVGTPEDLQIYVNKHQEKL